MDEWIAYGYGFPPTAERLATFAEHLEVITRMLEPGRATWFGERVSVDDAINVPRGIQEHIPLIVGGNGRKKTAGLAVKHADELNFVFLDADEVAERMVDVRAKCEEAGRDPDSLRFSVYTYDDHYLTPGQHRIDRIRAYADVGVDRIVCFPTKREPTVETQASFAEDCRAAGIALG